MKNLLRGLLILEKYNPDNICCNEDNIIYAGFDCEMYKKDYDALVRLGWYEYKGSFKKNSETNKLEEVVSFWGYVLSSIDKIPTLDSTTNVCEHGDHLAPLNQRFCSTACEICEFKSVIY